MATNFCNLRNKVIFILKSINVVVNFLSQVIYIFPLFLGMAMYANKVETKEKLKLPGTKN